MRRATEYTRSGRWQNAVSLFSHLLQRDDNLNIRMPWFIDRGTNLYIRVLRGHALAEQGCWDETLADLEHVAHSGRGGFRVWYEVALARLGKEDPEGYQEACAKMLAKYGETSNPLTVESVAWTCSLRPQPNLNWGKLIAVAVLPFVDGEEINDAGQIVGLMHISRPVSESHGYFLIPTAQWRSRYHATF